MATSTTSDSPTSHRHFSIDVGRWLVILSIALAALFVWSLARGRIVGPFDSMVTEQMCLRHGEEIERPLLDFERSNRFALSNRTDGFCRYGPTAESEGQLLLTVEETEPGSLYTLTKAIGIIIQVGLVSIFVRLVTDPALRIYQAIRDQLTA